MKTILLEVMYICRIGITEQYAPHYGIEAMIGEKRNKGAIIRSIKMNIPSGGSLNEGTCMFPVGKLTMRRSFVQMLNRITAD
ncbi:MAG: hypothetical protein IT223_12220 [Crocinitomicaceae bacterium]|nr:hypothetical protein [Crocinitomicaceae bacterium]